MKALLAFLVLALSCLAQPTVPFAFFKGASERTTYFGNCQSDGSTPSGWGSTFDFYGAYTWYGNSAFEITCPGSGPQTVDLIGMYGKTRGAPHSDVRMAIYTYTEQSADGGTIYDSALALVCQWSAAGLPNSATAQWWDSSSFTGSTTLTGGIKYRIALSTASTLVNVGYNTGTTASKYIASSYTTGFPDPIGAGSTATFAPLMRARITGNGTSAPTPTQETYYVDTDYSGGGSTGSPTKPYTNLNAAIAARCNKTFTLPIVIYCKGVAADTTRVRTGTLGQMVPSAGNELRIVGDTGHRASASKSTSKYRLEPAFASGAGAGTALELSRSYIFIDGLQIGVSSQAGQDAACEIVYWSVGSTGKMTNCLIYGSNDSNVSNTTRGISSINGINIINTVIYNLGAGVGTGVKNHSNSNFYNCTVIGPAAGSGLDIVDGTSVAKNCYVSGGSAGALIVSGTLNKTTVATSDSSGSSGLTSIAVNTTNFVNVTLGSEDFHIPTGSALKNVGTDTSGDASPFNFTTDIDGNPRTGTWDVGVHEFQ